MNARAHDAEPRKWNKKHHFSPLKSLKKQAQTRFFNAFPSLCSQICRSEFQPQNLNRRGYFSETPYQSQRNGVSMTTKRRFRHSETGTPALPLGLSKNHLRGYKPTFGFWVDLCYDMLFIFIPLIIVCFLAFDALYII